MSKLATMGTFSCATMSISGFKKANRDANEQYKAGEEVTTLLESRSDLTVAEFYTNILYPTEQELGETKEYPFQELMEKIDEHNLNEKMVFAVVNAASHMDGYWKKELERHDFRLLEVTGNDWGSDNFVYCRTPLRRTSSPLYGDERFAPTKVEQNA